GDGENSPFTTALVKHIATPGLEINAMLTRVRADVFKATEGKQRPWTNSSLLGEVVLVSKN
ncbi:MAG: caspase family protein, partial [Rhizobiales bacterium]|nr:caspase family protein [Hyphomicrobiales bacterium]